MEIHSLAWFVFVNFMPLSSSTAPYLFITIIIDSMQAMQQTELEQAVEEVSFVVHHEHGLRSAECQEFRQELLM